MLTIRLRKTAALLIVLGLQATALPVAAAPQGTADAGGHGHALVQTFIRWLVDLWPGTERSPAAQPGAVLRGRWAALGDDGDPDEAPRAATAGPEAQAELGDDLDPNG